MNEIKPIETIYNGYRFRSRLEARWAVFFDAAGIKYQYEPDGFEFNGEKYLPDFYLTDFDMYVEVKPEDPKRKAEIKRAVEVCCMETRKMLLLFGEIPNIDNCGMWVYNSFYYHTADKSLIWRPAILRLIEDNSYLITDYSILRKSETWYHNWLKGLDGRAHFPISGISLATFEIGSEYSLPGYEPSETRKDEYRCNVYDLEEEHDFEFAKQAYDQARQARFEYGQTPKA